MKFKQRTHNCGELRIENENQLITLNGWIASRRDLGGLIFIDLRDRWGITQVVIEPSERPDLAEKAKDLRSEFVLSFTGKVRKRENTNPNIPTGLIEVVVEDFELINKAELTPFEILDDTNASEELRLKYRYLDLRRHSLQDKFLLRNKVYQLIHSYYYKNDFVEIETPVLMKSTPEGARDFLVPSRISKGKFYALPQSPQIFKQILMISGFDRYMQIVKCFRDEDLRSDRQPEFTQIDVEMSFVQQDDILNITEGLFTLLWKETINYSVPSPFPRMTYADAMSRYGSDKPDTRFEMELCDISSIVSNSDFKVFTDAINTGGSVIAINAKGCAGYSRKQIDELTEFAKKYGAKGLAWIKLTDDTVNSPIAKFMKDDELKSIFEKLNAENGDLILISSDKTLRSQTIMGALRLEIARREGIMQRVKDQYNFLWVVDFPLMEYDEESQRYYSMHHPFTSPNSEDIPLLDTDLGSVRAMAYDLVVNGAELGGGSIRIHNNEIQQRMFSILGLNNEEIESKFGFLINALKYGAPPHGGIAFGLDRIIMSLAKTENIRDVIAFPKTTSGLSLMDGSPSIVDETQLADLGIQLLKKE